METRQKRDMDKKQGYFDSVTKRDLRVVSFDKAKIIDAIFKAAKAAGGEDRQMAEELASVVTLFLRNKFGSNSPSIEEIQDVVEKVLMETGHAKTAKRYILYRERRAEARKDLRVRKKTRHDANSTDIALMVTPLTKDEILSWDKAKVASALVKEADLDVELANEIASAVETKIVDSNITHISTSLIREIVDNELFTRGLNKKLQQQATIGMPTYDLETLIFSKSKENANINSNNPEAINLAIAETTLKQYALQRIFSKDISESHMKGEIHLHDLGYPTRVYCSSHSLEYIKKYGLHLTNLDTQSAPAKYARTLTGHLNTFLASMQAYYAGALGVAYVNIMYAPYLEGMTDKQMRQEAQHLIFSASQNAFSRGGQSLFIDHNIHTGIPNYLKKIPAIGPSGKYTGKTYGDYEEPAQRFARAMLSVWQKGDEYGKPFAFPKCIDKETKLLLRINGKTRIYTAKEAHEMKSLMPSLDIELPNFNLQTRENEWVKLSKSLHRGTESGIAVTLPNNIIFKTTADHPHVVLTENGLKTKEAKDIAIGDTLLYKMPGHSLATEKKEYLRPGEEWKLKRHNYLCRGTLTELPQALLLEHLAAMPVKKIEEALVDAYAIEVEGNDHTFITADGILTHNCDFHISKETLEDPKQRELFEYACQVASENGSPYFVFDRDEVTLSACCRLRTRIKDNYMIEHPESMRFCGFQNVTINLPQAAYRAGRGNTEALYKEIDRCMDLAVKAHQQKKEFIWQLMAKPHLPMWEVGKIALDGKPYVDLEKATYIIGIVGLNECVQHLTGKQLHEDEDVYKLGLRIISFMAIKAKEAEKKLGLKFSLEESPAESAARRLAKVDLKQYTEETQNVIKGDIENDMYYYTNSIHFAANAPIDLITRIQKQAKFHTMIESGAIIHAFVGEKLPSKESIMNLVEKTFYKTQAAQLTISPEFTICNSCHKKDNGLNDTCSVCNSDDVYGMTRIVGYYSRISNWNRSKLGELGDRRANPTNYYVA